MGLPELGPLSNIVHLRLSPLGRLGARVGDMHLINLSPAAKEGDGMGEEHAVRGQEVAVWRLSQEVLEPDAEGEGDEDGLMGLRSQPGVQHLSWGDLFLQ